MKPGDLVSRKWKPQFGTGTIIHVLGESIVVRWVLNNKPKIVIEKQKHLKRVERNKT